MNISETKAMILVLIGLVFITAAFIAPDLIHRLSKGGAYEVIQSVSIHSE